MAKAFKFFMLGSLAFFLFSLPAAVAVWFGSEPTLAENVIVPGAGLARWCAAVMGTLILLFPLRYSLKAFRSGRTPSGIFFLMIAAAGSSFALLPKTAVFAAAGSTGAIIVLFVVGYLCFTRDEPKKGGKS